MSSRFPCKSARELHANLKSFKSALDIKKCSNAMENLKTFIFKIVINDITNVILIRQLQQFLFSYFQELKQRTQP